MGRQQRGSRILLKAEKRLGGIQSIDEKLSISKRLNVQTYSSYINSVRTKLKNYNQAIADLDAMQIELDQAEAMLSDYSEQMLMGIGGEYGKDSVEYERAGGVRKSERKRPSRRTPIVAMG